MTIIDQALAILADKTLVHERVDANEKARRLSICESCPLIDPVHRKCTLCTCYVDVKTGAKTNFNPIAARNEITHCPNGFWGDAETVNFYREKDGIAPIVPQTQN